MKVLCNFELKSDQNKEYEPWLEDIFINLENYSQSDFVLRVSKESHNRAINYRIDNKKNKSYSIINKRRDNITVKTYKKCLPSNTDYIKPPYELVYEKIYLNTPEDKIIIAKDMVAILDNHNEYSENRVKKITVSLLYKYNSDTYFGGPITDIMDADENKIIFIPTGESFMLPTEELTTKRAAIGKFIIMDKSLKFDIFFHSEISQYFNLV